MPHAGLSRQFVNADSPIDLCFLADGKSIRVDECGVGAREDPSDVRVVEAAEGNDGDVGEGGEICCVGGVHVTRQDSDCVSAGCC